MEIHELIIENQKLREKVHYLQKLISTKVLVEEKEEEEKEKEEEKEEKEEKDEREEKEKVRHPDDVHYTNKPWKFYSSLRPLTQKEIKYIQRYIKYLKMLK